MHFHRIHWEGASVYTEGDIDTSVVMFVYIAVCNMECIARCVCDTGLLYAMAAQSAGNVDIVGG